MAQGVGVLLLLFFVHTGSAQVDFRLYVTSPDEIKIYEFDDVGATMNTFDTHSPAIGIAFDHFTSEYSITPTAPSFVYSINYTGYAEFYRQYLSSPTPEYIYTSPVTDATVKRIKIDPTSGNMFYIGVVSNSPSSSFIAVLTPSLEHVNIISGMFEPADIAMHAGHGLLFWSIEYDSAIYSAYMDGSENPNIPLVSGVSAVALAVDSQANMLYWADSSSASIESCDFDGNRGPTLIYLPDIMVADIMIDGRTLFYTNSTSSEIVKVELDGSHTSYLVSYIPGVNQLGAMTAYSTDSLAVPKNVYCDFRDGRADCSDVCLPNVMGRSCRCPNDAPLQLNDRTCTNAELCNDTIPNAFLSTLCDKHKFEVCDFSCNYPYTSSISQLRCEGTYWNVTNPCTDTSTAGSTTIYPGSYSSSTGGFTTVDFRLYVTSPNENKIYAFDDVGATMETFGTYGPAIGLDFDHFDSAYSITPTAPSFVYSINYMGTAEFYRQYLGSTTPEYIYTCPVTDATVKRIKIDPTSGNMFYLGVVSNSPSSSFIAVLTPSLEHVNIISGIFDPDDTAVHAEQGLVFWSVVSDSAIYSAYMDGSGDTNTPMISGVSAHALAVDSQANMLYWADSSSTSIESCDFYGIRGPTLAYLPDMMIADILIDGRTLFYTNTTSSEIGKVDLDGSQISTLVSYIPGVNQLGVMTAYSSDSTAVPKNVYCNSRDGRGDCSDICLPNAMGRSCRCRDDAALKPNDRTCTNADICNATIPHASLSTLCDKHKLDVCEFSCNFPYTSSISQLRCEGTYWNVPDPCTDTETFGSTTSYPDPSGPGSGDFRLYVTNSNRSKIYSIDQYGTVMETETVYVFENLFGIAVDRFTPEFSTARPSIVYSTFAYNSATFYRQYMDGGTYEYMFNEYDAISERFAIDQTSGNIYYIAKDAYSQQSNISVFTPYGDRTSIITGLYDPKDIVLQPEQGRLFWTDITSNGGTAVISTADMDGANVRHIISENIVSPNGLAISYYENMLYWTDSDLNQIEKCDFDGQQRSTVMSTPGIRLKDILIDGNYFYFTNLDNSDITRVDLYSYTSETYASIYDDQGLGLEALAVYSTDFLRINGQCERRNGLGDCSDLCLPNTMGHSCACFYGGHLDGNSQTCDNAILCPSSFPTGSLSESCSQHRYEVCEIICEGSGQIVPIQCDEMGAWNNTNPCAASTAIGFRLYVNSPDENKVYAFDDVGAIMATFDTYGVAKGLAVDHFTSEYSITPTSPSFVYSVDYMGGADFDRQYLTDSTSPYMFISSVSGATVERLVIDPTSGNIFYIGVVSGSSSYIAVMTPSLQHISLVSGLTQPEALAMHAGQGLLFWSDTADHSISSVYMDGSGRIDIVGAVFTNVLAVDSQANMLYWIDSSSTAIESCDFYGNRGQNLTYLPDMMVADIMIDGRTLFYTNSTSSEIVKVDLDGSHTSSHFSYIPGVNRLGAMTAYSSHSTAIPKNVYCNSRDGRGDCSDICLPSGMGRSCRCRDDVALKPNDRTCTNADLCSDTIPHVSLSTLCDRHKFDVCDFSCNYPYTSLISQLRCEGTYWNVTDPCTETTTGGSTTSYPTPYSPSSGVENPDFRFVVTNSHQRQIYTFNQAGDIMNTYEIYDTVRGVAMDNFRSQYDSGPVRQSFVYSVDYSGSGGADFFRQYLDETTPQYLFSSPVSGAVVDRLAIDTTSGNIYYVGNVPGSQGFIGVITPYNDHVTLIEGLSEPKAIALYTVDSRIFWSDVGQSVIRSAFMDGSDQTDAVNSVRCYGMAVDYQESILYYTDLNSEAIMSYDIQSTGIGTVKTFHHLTLNDILVDGDFLYYTNMNYSEVGKINKTVIEDETTFAYVPATTSLNAMAVFSWDSTVQHGSSSCYDRDGLGDCSNVCLPTTTTTHVCACHDGVSLKGNGITCENAQLCPQTISHGSFLSGCNWHILEVCGVQCDDGILTSHIQCEGTRWNDMYPCSDQTTPVSTTNDPTLQSNSISGSPYSTYPTYSYSGSSYPTYPTNSYWSSSYSMNPTYSYSGSSYPTYPTNSYWSSSYSVNPTYSYSGSSYPTFPTSSYWSSSYSMNPTYSYSGSSYPTYPTNSYWSSSYSMNPTYSYTGSSYPTYPTNSYWSSSYSMNPTYSYTGSSYPTYPTNSYWSSSYSMNPTYSYTGSSYPTYPTNSYWSSSYSMNPTYSYSGSSYPTYPTYSYWSSSYSMNPTYSYSGSSYPTYPTNSYWSSSYSMNPTYSYSGPSYPTFPTSSYWSSSYSMNPTYSYSGSSYPTYPTNSYWSSSYSMNPTYSYTGSSYPTYPTNSYWSSSYSMNPTYSYSGSSYPTYPTNSYWSSSYSMNPTYSYSGSSYPTYPTSSYWSSSYSMNPTYSYSGSSYPTYPTNSYWSSAYSMNPTYSYSGSSYPTYPTSSYWSSSYSMNPTYSYSGSSYTTYPTNSYWSSAYSMNPTYSYSGSSYPTYPTSSYWSSSYSMNPTYSYSGSSYPTYPTNSYWSSSYSVNPTYSYSGSSYPTYPTNSQWSSSYSVNPTYSYSGSSHPTYPTYSYWSSSYSMNPTYSYSGSSHQTFPTYSYSGSSHPTYPTYSYSGSSYSMDPTYTYSSSSYLTNPSYSYSSSGTGTAYPTGQTLPPSGGSGSTYPTGQTLSTSSGFGSTYPTGQTFPSSSGTGSDYSSGQTFPPSSGSGSSNPTGTTLSTSSGSHTVNEVTSTQAAASSGSAGTTVTTSNAVTGGNTAGTTANAVTGGNTAGTTVNAVTGGNTAGTTGNSVTGGNTAGTTANAVTGGNTTGTTANSVTGGNTAGTTGNALTGGNTTGTTGNVVTGGQTASTAANTAAVGATTTVQTTTAGAVSTFPKYVTAINIFVSLTAVAIISKL